MYSYISHGRRQNNISPTIRWSLFTISCMLFEIYLTGILFAAWFRNTHQQFNNITEAKVIQSGITLILVSWMTWVVGQLWPHRAGDEGTRGCEVKGPDERGVSSERGCSRTASGIWQHFGPPHFSSHILGNRRTESGWRSLTEAKETSLRQSHIRKVKIMGKKEGLEVTHIHILGTGVTKFERPLPTLVFICPPILLPWRRSKGKRLFWFRVTAILPWTPGLLSAHAIPCGPTISLACITCPWPPHHQRGTAKGYYQNVYHHHLYSCGPLIPMTKNQPSLSYHSRV